MRTPVSCCFWPPSSRAWTIIRTSCVPPLPSPATTRQDDKVCAYSSLAAMMELENVKNTAVCILSDKEEIGSMGNTGMESHMFDFFISEILNKLRVHAPANSVYALKIVNPPTSRNYLHLPTIQKYFLPARTNHAIFSVMPNVHFLVSRFAHYASLTVYQVPFSLSDIFLRFDLIFLFRPPVHHEFSPVRAPVPRHAQSARPVVVPFPTAPPTSAHILAYLRNQNWDATQRTKYWPQHQKFAPDLHPFLV
ncbi:MAG: hypothetical protein II219_00830 [Alphaproteobacteria bacterium]|nr:hypothetical protein [Alphaproteobacteria bacterium]